MYLGCYRSPCLRCGVIRLSLLVRLCFAIFLHKFIPTQLPVGVPLSSGRDSVERGRVGFAQLSIVRYELRAFGRRDKKRRAL